MDYRQIDPSIIVLWLSFGILNVLYAFDLAGVKHIAVYTVGMLCIEWFRRRHL
jgi:hypothetical protein